MLNWLIDYGYIRVKIFHKDPIHYGNSMLDLDYLFKRWLYDNQVTTMACRCQFSPSQFMNHLRYDKLTAAEITSIITWIALSNPSIMPIPLYASELKEHHITEWMLAYLFYHKLLPAYVLNEPIGVENFNRATALLCHFKYNPPSAELFDTITALTVPTTLDPNIANQLWKDAIGLQEVMPQLSNKQDQAM